MSSAHLASSIGSNCCIPAHKHTHTCSSVPGCRQQYTRPQPRPHSRPQSLEAGSNVLVMPQSLVAGSKTLWEREFSDAVPLDAKNNHLQLGVRENLAWVSLLMNASLVA
eukprot:14885161-Alexandrium_andersonii.AAC.1